MNPETEEGWRLKLTPIQFDVLREKGTENPYKGEYYKHFEQGVYNCAGCGAALYKSDTKFDSDCGWPAFFDAIPGLISFISSHSLPQSPHFFSYLGALIVEGDYASKAPCEIMCKNCGGHLGHIFQVIPFITLAALFTLYSF